MPDQDPNVAPEPEQGPQASNPRETGRRSLVPQSHGGALLTPHPPGSNGGVHRGPDRHPRVTQAILLQALSEAQVRVVEGVVGPDGKPATVVVEMAATKDLVKAIQRVCQRAAKGRDLAYALKLLEITDKAFRNGKNGNGHHGLPGPMAPQFVRPPAQAAEPAEEPEAPQRDDGLTLNGEDYA